MVQHGVNSFDQVPELPKRLVTALNEKFTFVTSRVLKRTDACDGSTTKLLIELQDGLCVESVIMRYGHVELDSFPEQERLKIKPRPPGERGFKCNKRATLCVSSQVGCAMGCTFCGTMGLMANLSAGEILEQLYHASQIEKIRGVVFMGMGEPLDNYDAVLKAINGMTDTARFGISPHRVSISTVGVVPRILSLIRDAPDVGLALSLHAPTQDLRVQIVPTAKAWNINKIMDATDKFIANQNAGKASRNRKRHVLIEYVMIKDVNDTPEVAHQLGMLLKGREVLLNLIPYNPTSVPHDYKSPTEKAKREFVDIVRNEYKVHTTLRQTLGQDIDSACGQLVIDNTSLKKNSCSTDLEDLVRKETKTHKPQLSKRKSKASSQVETTTIMKSKIDVRLVFGSVIFLLLAIFFYRRW